MSTPDDIQRIIGNVPNVIVDDILNRAQDRAHALEVLAQRRSPTGIWPTSILIILGAVLGWLLSQYSSPWLLGIIAGVAFAGAGIALRHCIDLGRRVDAIVELLPDQKTDGA